MHHHQADVVDFTFWQEQRKLQSSCSPILQEAARPPPEQPLPDQIAHKVLMRRANGTGQPKHSNLPHEGQVQLEQQVAQSDFVLS